MRETERGGEVAKLLSWAGPSLELSFPEDGGNVCANRGDSRV